jgi:hypothetical protein
VVVCECPFFPLAEALGLAGGGGDMTMVASSRFLPAGASPLVARPMVAAAGGGVAGACGTDGIGVLGLDERTGLPGSAAAGGAAFLEDVDELAAVEPAAAGDDLLEEAALEAAGATLLPACPDGAPGGAFDAAPDAAFDAAPGGAFDAAPDAAFDAAFGATFDAAFGATFDAAFGATFDAAGAGSGLGGVFCTLGIAARGCDGSSDELAADPLSACGAGGGAAAETGMGVGSRGSLWRCGHPHRGEASAPAPPAPATAVASTG